MLRYCKGIKTHQSTVNERFFANGTRCGQFVSLSRCWAGRNIFADSEGGSEIYTSAVEGSASKKKRMAEVEQDLGEAQKHSYKDIIQIAEEYNSGTELDLAESWERG